MAVVMPCLVLAAVAGEPNASRKPPLGIEETIEHYDVRARDRIEMVENMRVPGAGNAFRHAHGLTRASFTVERMLTQESGRCRIDSLGIRLKLHITLPRWAPGVGIPKVLRNEWETMRELVVAHENRHKQHALDAAFAMRDRFASIEPSASCPRVEAMLQRELHAALLRQQLADQFLDQRRSPAALQIVEDDARDRKRTMPSRGR